MAFAQGYDPHNVSGIHSTGALVGGTVSPAPKPPTPLDDIASTLDAARVLSLRIRQIADQVLGSVPEPTAAGLKEQDRPAGSIPRLQCFSSETSTVIGDAMQACTRLERALS